MPTSLTLLGPITRLQIQRAILTVGERPDRRYDPSALLSVNTLTLLPEGAVAHTETGEALMDVHHRAHPQSRYRDNNSFSFNVTGHYAAMRAEYGPHLTDGIAGENILIAYDQRLDASALVNGLAIERQSDGTLVWLREISVAHPCRPFSGYVLGGTEASVKEALRFLDHGTRGFYGMLAQAEAATIAIGDRVFIGA